jgi:hypothetical protein
VAPLGDPESIAALAAWTRPCRPAVPDGAAPNSCQSCPDPCPRSTHAPDPALRPYPSPGDVMARYLAGRVAQAVVVLWAAYTVSFVVLFALPGDPVSTLLGADSSDVSAEQVDAVRAQYGFDRPLPVQYVQQLGRVLRGDLGRSVGTGRPVVDLIAEAVPPTAQVTRGGAPRRGGRGGRAGARRTVGQAAVVWAVRLSMTSAPDASGLQRTTARWRPNSVGAGSSR